MVEINLNNDYAKVVSGYDNQVISAITDVCSYRVPNAEWSPKYQNGTWDGHISIFYKKTMSFPVGLTDLVCQKLTELNIKYQINDNRPKPKTEKLAVVDLGEHSFRDYQQKAIEIFKEKTRGILAMCTGAGKTKTSCGLISEMSSYPVVFVVPSVSLLLQTADEFRRSLKPLDPRFKVGVIGGGQCDIAMSGVNVATYHTLLTAFNQKYSDQKKKIVDVENDKVSIPALEKQLKILQVDYDNSPKNKLKGISTKIKKVEKQIQEKQKFLQNKIDIRELIEKCQFLIIDETHIAAEVIESISLKAKNAYYKCGLSGTPQRLDNQDVRMFGATGSIIHRVTSSQLIKRGFLDRPYIYITDLEFMDKTSATHHETYKNAIILNEQRNELIRDIAIETKNMGRPTLVLVERLDHGKILEEMIEGSLFVPGGDGSDDAPIPEEEMDYRRYQLKRLEENEIIMIATSWAFTGIDAPKISSIVLACSLGSPNTVTQQIGRGLRKAPGKDGCLIFDFKMKEKNLRAHHYSRSKVYKSEEEFYIKTLKYNNDKGQYV